MKAKLKDLRNWAKNNTPVTYKNGTYKVFYNGFNYFLYDKNTQDVVQIIIDKK